MFLVDQVVFNAQTPTLVWNVKPAFSSTQHLVDVRNAGKDVLHALTLSLALDINQE